MGSELLADMFSLMVIFSAFACLLTCAQYLFLSWMKEKRATGERTPLFVYELARKRPGGLRKSRRAEMEFLRESQTVMLTGMVFFLLVNAVSFLMLMASLR